MPITFNTMYKLFSHGIDLYDIFLTGKHANLLSKFGKRRVFDTEEKETKKEETEKTAKVSFGGLGIGDDIIWSDLTLELDPDEEKDFRKFIEWLSKNHFLKYRAIIRFFVEESLLSKEKASMHLSRLVGVIQANGRKYNETLKYCELKHYTSTTTSQAIKKLVDWIKGKAGNIETDSLKELPIKALHELDELDQEIADRIPDIKSPSYLRGILLFECFKTKLW